MGTQLDDDTITKIAVAVITALATHQDSTNICPLSVDETHIAHHKTLAEILEERVLAAKDAEVARTTRESIKAQVVGWSFVTIIGGMVYVAFLGAVEFVKKKLSL